MPVAQQIGELFTAIHRGDFLRVQELIRSGVPIESREEVYDPTPLCAAAREDREQIFNWLLSAGADPSAPSRADDRGWPGHALSCACVGDSASRVRMFRTLLNDGIGKHKVAVQRSFLQARSKGAPEMVQGLIDAGANIKPDPAFGSHLIAVVRENERRDEIVPILLRAGVDIAEVNPPQPGYDARDKGYIGKTALEIAEVDGHTEVARMLRASGAVLLHKRAAKKTPTSVPKSWARIEAWLKANAKKWKPLRPPATSAQIAKAEERLGLKLPADVRASYLLHNGTTDDGFFPDHAGDNVGWFLFPLSRLISESKMMRELLDRGDLAGTKPKAGNGIRAEQWHPKWIPFAGNGGGDCWCIDLAPATGGTRGQVIYSSHEMEPRKLIARSFREWLSASADSLEAGEYRYEEGEGFVHR